MAEQRKVAQADDLDLTKVELPKGYKRNGKLYKTAFIREVTGRDQEELLKQSIASNPAIQTSVLLARIVKKLVAEDGDEIMVDTKVAGDMSIGDRNTLIIKAKEADSGPELSLTVTCPHCAKTFEAGVQVSSFFGGSQS